MVFTLYCLWCPCVQQNIADACSGSSPHPKTMTFRCEHFATMLLNNDRMIWGLACLRPQWDAWLKKDWNKNRWTVLGVPAGTLSHTFWWSIWDVWGVSHLGSFGTDLDAKGNPKASKRMTNCSRNGALGMSVEEAKHIVFIVREASGEVLETLTYLLPGSWPPTPPPFPNNMLTDKKKTVPYVLAGHPTRFESVHVFFQK